MSVLIRNGGGATRVKVDGIPPTERLNLSKIGGEKYVTLDIKLDINSLFDSAWERENDYIGMVRGDNYHDIYRIEKDGKCELLVHLIFPNYSGARSYGEICVMNEKIYFVENKETTIFYDSEIRIYLIDEFEKTTTLLNSLKKLNVTKFRLCGIENENIYLLANDRSIGNFNILKYDIKNNTFTEMYRFINDIVFMPFINNTFYAKEYDDVGTFYKIENGLKTEISKIGAGDLIIINNELYKFEEINTSTHEGYKAFDIYKMNFLNETFEIVAKKIVLEAPNTGYLGVFRPNPERLIYSNNTEIKICTKELYLTEKREE